MTTIWPSFYNKLSEKQQKFAITQAGMNFIFKFLFKKGHHLFIIGTSGSGKTQKAYWLANWIRHTKETVIWIDSAKNREMVPLITMGTPVRIICPKGCDVELTEWNDDEHKYIRMKNHPEVVQVPEAESAWWAVKRGYINIFCFRVAFSSDQSARNWMAELFRSLSAGLNKKTGFPKILPFSLFGDESHWFLAGEKISTEEQRRKLAELITELSLENRAYEARMILMAQSHKSLPPASRENMIHNLICRGCKVPADENPTLAVYNKYSSSYQPKEGVFVFEGGYAYPKNPQGEGYPWPFPFFPMPKLRVEYKGYHDDQNPIKLEQEEIEREMTPEIDKYQGILSQLEGYEIPKQYSRFEVMPNET